VRARAFTVMDVILSEGEQPESKDPTQLNSGSEMSGNSHSAA